MLLLILSVSDVDPVDPKPVIVTKEKTVYMQKPRYVVTIITLDVS